PQTHGHRRHQEQVQPGVEVEEGYQIRLTALVEPTQIEGEDGGQHQEDDDEDIGQRGSEIAGQLPFEDHVLAVHAASSAVRLRNTSSRRTRLTDSSLTCHCSWRACSPTAGWISTSGWASTICSWPSRATFTPLTPGSASSAAVSTGCCSSRVTAWW